MNPDEQVNSYLRLAVKFEDLANTPYETRRQMYLEISKIFNAEAKELYERTRTN